MFTILHISDLHRSPRYPITNDELISALVSDRERYRRESPPVAAPDAIVVSGDVVQGVSLRTPDFAARLTEQYMVANEFLDELTKRFVDGDRSRVVIVPGNHDIDWNTARQAMSLVCADDAPKDIAAELFRDDSFYRWSWNTRELYQIVNRQVYEERLGAFWKFVENFYAGTPGLWRFEPGSDVNLFRLCDGRIGVAAFNSCHGNDCFAFHGMIRREAVSRSYLDLTQGGHTFDLHIAVWHHSIEGPPYRTDYMDVDLVRAMVGRGFRLGLHGHQHKAQATPQNVFLPDRETMAVVSAGSLCAGANDLPPGVNRQYNVIEIADNFCSVKVHVREMTVGNLFGRASLVAFGGRGFAELEWEPPKDLGGRPIDAAAERLRATIETAEGLLKAGNPAGSVSVLAPEHAVLTGYGRQLLIDSAAQARDWKIILELIDIPQSVEELIRRIEAFLSLRRPADARETLDRFARRLNLDNAVERDLRARVAAEEAMLK